MFPLPETATKVAVSRSGGTHLPSYKHGMSPARDQTPISGSAYARWLLAVVLLWGGLWSINPKHPQDFFLEHILTVLVLGGLVATHRRFPLTNTSYTLIALFVMLHCVGAHTTYSEVPYDRWVATVVSWFGVDGFSLNEALGFERNHFDRLVHFAFGVLLVHPLREFLARTARVTDAWAATLAVVANMALSMLYELLEWGVAVVMTEDVSQSYLGTQGDVWDAHADMALASLGALLATIPYGVSAWRARRRGHSGRSIPSAPAVA